MNRLALPHAKSIVLWLLLTLSFAINTSAKEIPAIPLDQLDGRPLIDAQYRLSDARASLDDVVGGSWRPFGRSLFNRGISQQAHWLHFKVRNPSKRSIDWVIRGETSYLDNLVVWTRSGNGDFTRLSVSDREAFHERLLDYRTLSLPLSTGPGATSEIYLKAWHDKPDTVSLLFALHTEEGFDDLRNVENLVFGTFYGALGIMLILAFMAAALLREKNAVNYGLFLLMTLLMWLMLNGYGFQYLWPRNTWWHNEGFHLVFLGFSITALQFSKYLLSLRQYFPPLFRLFSGIQILAIGAMVLRLTGSYLAVLAISYLILGLVALLIPVVSYLVWRRGADYAFWCLIAWSIYSLGLILALASASSTNLAWGMSALIWLQAGSLLETIFLSLAMISRVVKLRGEHQRAFDLALQDPLTGLGNRRLLQTAIEQFLAERAGDVFVVMLDLDDFKQINDRFGHEAGDAVLVHIGRLIRENCRDRDVAIRLGGDEFALLLPAENLADAMGVAERIRNQFRENPTLHNNREIRHTLSCGAAALSPGNARPQVEAIMRGADRALYRAKAQGGDRSFTFHPG